MTKNNNNDNEWQEILSLDQWTIAYLLDVIDDAQTHSFEFKVGNGKLYFREQKI